jgi:hypothetical protein
MSSSIGLVEEVEVTIKIRGYELACLKKLSLVSHALAARLPYQSQLEQKTLAYGLDDLIRRIELGTITRKN